MVRAQKSLGKKTLKKTIAMWRNYRYH